MDLVAISFRQLAVLMYQLGGEFHQNEAHESLLRDMLEEIPAEIYWERNKLPPRTFFYNEYYRDFEQYPNGVADVVGYWAETQVFGGVVVFDRGESDTEVG